MAVRSFYEGGKRDIGAPLVVDFMKSWFDTRAAMNDAALAQEAGEDPADLAKQELDARKILGELHRELADATKQQGNDASELARTALEVQGRDRVASSAAATQLGIAKMELTQNLLKQATNEAEAINKEADLDDETIAKLRSLAAAGDNPKIANNRFQALAKEQNAGAVGNVKYDAMAMKLQQFMAESGTPTAAQVAKLTSPNNEGVSPVEWFNKRHHAATYDEQVKRADEIARKYRAGSDSSAIWGTLTRMGVDVSKMGIDGGESTRIKTQTGTRDDVDPYAPIRAEIARQSAYADDLARRREEASLNRKSRYPAGNRYLVNPNTYVNERGQSAATIMGQDDPGRNRERATDILQGRAPGEYEAEFAPRQYDAERFGKDGDLGAWFADAIDKPVEVDDPDGEYRYRVDPNGDVTIIKSPVGKGGQKLERGSEGYERVMSIAGTPTATLLSQPAEVQTLFGEAIALARAGKSKEAAEAARRIEQEDVRGAYGIALRRAARDPAEIERLTVGIGALPVDIAGEWGAAFNDAIDHYGRNWQRGGDWAKSQVTGSVASLGDALLDSRGTRARGKAKEDRTDAEERADKSARTRYDLGREAAVNAWEEGKPSPAGDGEFGKGVEAARETMARSGPETVRQQRTDTLSGDVTYKLPRDRAAVTGDALARDWSDQRDPDLEELTVFAVEPAKREMDPITAATVQRINGRVKASQDSDFADLDAFGRE